MPIGNGPAYFGNPQNLYLGDFSSAPSGAVNGQYYFNTTSNKIWIYSNGAFVPVLGPVNEGTSGQVLLSGGANALPTWGTVAIANGGTGQTSKASAFDALQPMTTGGDLIYGGASGTGTRLANGTSGQVLKSNGTTTAPSWTTDIAGNAANVTGTVAIANGGTGQTTKAAGFDALQPMTTSGDVIYGGASGTGTRLAKGSDGQVLTLASGLPSWASGATITNGAASDLSFSGFGSVTNNVLKTVLGSLFQYLGNVQLGTTAASTASINLTTNINTTVWGSNQTQVGTWQSLENVTLTQGTLFYDGSDATKIYFCQTTDASKNYLKLLGVNIANTSESLQVRFSYPT